MAAIQLTGSTYLARSPTASVQRCLNLYTETVPAEQGEDVRVVDYPTPGLLLLATGVGAWRCLYRATGGSLYGVSGSNVYAISATWALTVVGTIPPGTSLCFMADNGLNVVLVDGSSFGWSILISTNAFLPIPDVGFYGGTSVWYIDTFFVLNKPGTNIYYASDSLAITFDALNFASKSSYADPLSNLVVVSDQIWLIGTTTTEIHDDIGGAAFPFQKVQGVLIEHGTNAPYSVARTDGALFFLSSDLAGRKVVLQGSGYSVERISDYGMEAQMQTYGTTDDAEAYCVQYNGHEFYRITFPSAGKSWAFDRAEKRWHELAYIDANGVESRHRSRVCATLGGQIVVGDFGGGNLYALDIDTYTDNGQPIKRTRTFPHMTNDQNRVSYSQFIALMECGSILSEGDAEISLRWSDDGGRSWGNPMTQSFGTTGEYITSVQWQRMGMARNRVFELSWSSAAKTALLGASILTVRSAS